MEMDGNECCICCNNIVSKRHCCFKSASCCGIMRQMHNKCAMKYYSQKYSDSETTFNLDAWTMNQSLQMVMQSMSCRLFIL